uniref:BRO1 domain-containing protein n=1 Tax=Araucaria cunninghamii TaxID=56994 RepID=A0A0D6QZH8_ARACU
MKDSFHEGKMLLHFHDPAKLKTKKVMYEETYYARDSGTLEQLKELSSGRRAFEESINGSSFITEAIAREMAGGTTSRIQQDLQKLERYLPLLGNLVMCVESVGDNHQILQWTTDLKIRWTSSLSASSAFSLGGPKFFRIDNLRFEYGMALFLYGALLRERALEFLSSDLVESATLFRKAAGVYQYLAQDVLPPLQPKLTSERPLEATPSVASIMSLVSLAEAQSVTVRKAEAKATSGGLLAKLHYGVVQFLEEANSLLKSSTGDWNDASERFKRFLSGCSILHEARSQRYIADDLKASEQLGLAIGVLRYGMSNFQGKLPGKALPFRVFLQLFVILLELQFLR